jgi:O-antigen ligase
VAVAILVQEAVGDRIELMTPGQVMEADVLGEGLGVLRIAPPGQTLILISFITSICFVINQRGKSFFSSGYFYLAMLLGAGLALTFVRTYLIAILLCIGTLMVLATAEERRRLLALLATSAAILLLVVAVSWGINGKLSDTLYALPQRYLTLLAGNDLIESGSLSDRRLENRYAMEQIRMHPVSGIGLGNDYRPPMYGPEDTITYYVHNAYLWLIMDMGIPGFILFMCFYIGFLIRAIKNFKKVKDKFLKPVITGSMLAGIAMLPMAFVIPLFMEWHSIVVIAIFIGLSESVAMHARKEISNQAVA